jgi:group I intron endonuclease
MSYIGSAINLAQRLRDYLSMDFINNSLLKGNSKIYHALLKNGYSKFSLDILEYCEPNILISREQYYLDLLNPEYNILKVARSRLGFKHSKATIEKMSSMNNHFFGKTHSYESRKMIGETLRGIIRVNNKSKFIKLETKLKLSSRSHGVPIKIFDRSNNLIKQFPTMTSAALYFGVHRKTIGNYLDKDSFYNDYAFKSNFKDNRVWVYDSNHKLIKVFNNVKNASKWYEIPHSTMYGYIKSSKLYKNKLYFYIKSGN